MTAYLRRELDAMSLDGDGTDVLVGLRNSLIGGRRFCISDIRALFVKWFKLRLLLYMGCICGDFCWCAGL